MDATEQSARTAPSYDDVIAKAGEGINQYLRSALENGLIDRQLFESAVEATLPTLTDWLNDPHVGRISPNAKRGIAGTVNRGDWESIVNAFRRNLGFGTGGIRGMMAFNRESIVRLQEEGIDAPILKGPNTLNNLVLLRVSAGVARYGNDHGFKKIVIGYDSRVRGGDFGRVIAELFLAFGYTVFLFDAPCPYPEVTFAIAHESIKADMGILISASHNDYRYNGYKLCSANGSQFDPQQRDEMYKSYITKSRFADVKSCPLDDADTGKLIYLGGAEKTPGVGYGGRPMQNIHDRHAEHIESFLPAPALLGDAYAAAAKTLKIGFCAFHGAGREAVPRLLGRAGFTQFKPITKNGLNDLNGLFPSFCSDPGKEQQPDPADPRAVKVALDAFEAEYPGELQNTDIVIGTDPDADRCSVMVRIPEDQRHLYGDQPFALLPADEMWALIIWYRLHAEAEKHGDVVGADTKFIVQSVTTSDLIVRVARKRGLGVVKTWVGFANLAAGTRMIWDNEPLPALREGKQSADDALCHPFVWEFEGMANGRRSFNYAAMEQSNGFSILGGPPPDERSLGEDGHVRDKDGTFAAILIADIAAYAKAKGMTLFEMVDKYVYLDPDVGLFHNLYEPDPLDGEYPGIQGDSKKKSILEKALDLYRKADAGGVVIGPFDVKETVIYRTGKYDHLYPPTDDFEFPDEGIRFYFSDDRLNSCIVRPSGTGNSLRFHVQLYSPVTKGDLIARKQGLRDQAAAVLDDLRVKLGAPRNA